MKKEYLQGMRAGIPVMIGFIPVGMAYAIMARQAGLTASETIFMSAAVFAGASQMLTVGMYAQGAGIFAMILAVFMLNLRHLIMSACVMNQIKQEKLSTKLFAAFGVTDESFAIFTTAENASTQYFIGVIILIYCSWVAGSAIGAFTASLLPDIMAASLGIALYAMFIGLLVPDLTSNSRLAILVIFTAVFNTILSQLIASSWALIISTLIGAAAGVFFVDLDSAED